MAWKKLGLIFDITQHKIPWLKSHAMLPTPLLLNDKLRIYFTGRNHKGQSQISFIDVNPDNPGEIIYVHDKPLFDAGKIGTFDDCGTVGTFILKVHDKLYLYYNGYNVRNTVPWSNSIGIAVSNDNGVMFRRLYEGPVMDRNPDDPYFTITPCIIKHGNTFQMWYTSGTGWTIENDIPEPLYEIKYATSSDAVNWTRENITCIPPNYAKEATAKASIIQDNRLYKMWFCYRGSQDFRDGADSYKIGYAEASISDPTNWERDDSKVGINPGPERYDNKMQAYPAVINIKDNRYLFYNGNGFGASGFCAAIWK